MKKVRFSVSGGTEFMLFILFCKSRADYHQAWGTSGEIEFMDMNVYLPESKVTYHLPVGLSVVF